MGKLNSLSVQKKKDAGLFNDGDGLYLQILKGGSKSWIFRFMLNGRSRAMGLGSITLVSLADARVKALEYRKLLLAGVDPIEYRKTTRQLQSLVTARSMTFAECADAFISSHRPSWKSQKHADQWKNTLSSYAFPFIGHLPIQEIDTALIMRVLEPIWYQKTETASRLRNRIEQIFDWATTRGFRSGENSARWRGHLENLLPTKASIQPTKHFTALPVTEMKALMDQLRTLDGVAARALEFLILTATRTSEVLGLRWSEIDFENAIWIIPAARMKAKREHRVPLSKRAIELLLSLRSVGNSEFTFCHASKKPLSNNAFLSLLHKRLGLNVTTHGFRSTFSDWANERTGYSREVIEMSLAHAIRDATEAAYRRGDLLLKRRALMADWSRFCAEAPSSASLLEFSGVADRTANLV